MLNNYQKGSIFGAVIVVIVFIFSFAAGPRTQSDPSNRTSAYVGEDHQQEKSFWDRLFNEPVNLFTLGLLLVGVSQAAMFLWQLQLIRESLSDAKTAANAAKESADAGKRSADTAEVSMIASERAYIHYNGMRYISHFDATKTQFFWRIRPTWVNSGNTPPKNLQIFVKYYLANEPLAANYDFTVSQQLFTIKTTIAPKATIESLPVEVLGSDLIAVASGVKYLAAFGVARYFDVFTGTPERITKFCVVCDSITGDVLKGWDAETNVVELRFITFPMHNCTDDDCA